MEKMTLLWRHLVFTFSLGLLNVSVICLSFVLEKFLLSFIIILMDDDDEYDDRGKIAAV